MINYIPTNSENVSFHIERNKFENRLFNELPDIFLFVSLAHKIELPTAIYDIVIKDSEEVSKAAILIDILLNDIDLGFDIVWSVDSNSTLTADKDFITRLLNIIEDKRKKKA